MRFSVIIPTFNRDQLLRNTLESIATVVPSDDSMEIIIVDNGSRDETADVCKYIQQKFSKHRWRYFYDDMPGLLTGRHRGANESTGDVLCYLDDDVLLEPTWYEGIHDAFQDPRVALAGGPSMPEYIKPPDNWIHDLWYEVEGGRICPYLSLIEMGGGKKEISPRQVYGLNYHIRKDVWLSCGGFHPDCMPKRFQRWQGDGESGLSQKIQEKGLGAIYHPEVGVRHVIPRERMEIRAFEQRGFYQGVCESFTQIRREQKVPAWHESWRDVLASWRAKLERPFFPRNPKAKRMRELFFRALASGRLFHQHEVRHDRNLLDWVLKPDYFEYRFK